MLQSCGQISAADFVEDLLLTACPDELDTSGVGLAGLNARDVVQDIRHRAGNTSSTHDHEDCVESVKWGLMSVWALQEELRADFRAGLLALVTQTSRPAVIGTDVEDKLRRLLLRSRVLVASHGKGVVFPAAESDGLVEVVMLTRARLQGLRGRVHLDADQIAFGTVGDRGGGCGDEALSELDVEVAVNHACIADGTIEAPNGNHRPEVAIIDGSVEAGVAAVFLLEIVM